MTAASPLPSGLPAVDRQWGGLAAGHAYLLVGRAGGGRSALALQTARAAVDDGQRCLLISSRPPDALMALGRTVGLDLGAAHSAGTLRLLRIPSAATLASRGPEALAAAYHDLVALVASDRPTRVVVEDFTPLVQFDTFERFHTAFSSLVGALRAQGVTLVIGLGDPANDASRRLLDVVEDLVDGTIQLGADGDLVLGAPGQATYPSSDGASVDAGPPELQDDPDSHDDPSGTAEATDAPPAPDAQPSEAHAPLAEAAETETAGQPEATPQAEVLPPLETETETEVEPQAEASPEAESETVPQPETVRQPEAGHVEAPSATPAPSEPAPASAGFETTFAVASPETPSAEPDAAEPDAFELADFEPSDVPSTPVFGGADEEDEHAPEPDDGTEMTPAAPMAVVAPAAPAAPSRPAEPLATEITAPPAPDPMLLAPGSDLFGHDPADALFEQGYLADSGAQPIAFPSTPTAPASPARTAPSPMPSFASLGGTPAPNSNASGSGFRPALDAAFAVRSLGTPFLVIALRAEPGTPAAVHFGTITAGLRAGLRDADRLLVDDVRMRAVALLPASTAEAGQALFANLQSHLRTTLGGTADGVLQTVAAVTVADGQPFETSADLLAYAFEG